MSNGVELWVWRIKRAGFALSGCRHQPRAQQIDLRASIHLSLHQLQFGDLAFGLPIGPRADDGRRHGTFVGCNAIGEGGHFAHGGIAEPWLEEIGLFGRDQGGEAVEQIAASTIAGEAVSVAVIRRTASSPLLVRSVVITRAIVRAEGIRNAGG